MKNLFYAKTFHHIPVYFIYHIIYLQTTTFILVTLTADAHITGTNIICVCLISYSLLLSD